MKTTCYLFLLPMLLLLGCAGPDAPKPPTAGSIEELREAWINRNGTVGSNVTIRVRAYRAEAATASIRFQLNENDMRNPCDGSTVFHLPIERLISSQVTPRFCSQGQEVWELVIDTSP